MRPSLFPSADAAPTKVGEKRKSKQSAAKVQLKRVKVEVEETVSDAEAEQLVCEMHAHALERVNSKLPGVVEGLVQQKKKWAEFQKKHALR